MALPLVAAGVFSGVLAGLAQFFASRAATILVGLGLAVVMTTGLSALAGVLIADMASAANNIGAAGGASGMGAHVMAMLAYGGAIDALNLIISGYLTMWALVALKVWVTRASA